VDRETFESEINALPVFDTHTHLNIPGVPIPAQSIWDIAHYFWFLRELQAAGYPVDPMELEEDRRYAALASAITATRNTSWNWAVRRMADALYDVTLANEDDFRTFDERIRGTSQNTDWPGKVIATAGVKRITVNIDADVELPNLDGVGCLLSVKPGADVEAALEAIRKDHLSGAALETLIDRTITDLESAIGEYADAGVRGIRIDNSPYEDPAFDGYSRYLERQFLDESSQSDVESLVAECRRYLYDELYRIAESREMLVQMFLGMKRRDIPVDTALNDTGRIVRLHPLFHRHPGITFELVMGCELNNLDVVQAARMYRNVNAGGLWWFNFRTSTYRQALHYRFEALPAMRSSIVATDARCIEWCFTKTMLVKKITADFLLDRIEKGWIDHSDALAVARNWLHDTAAHLYI
jgi:hypothetical protein